MKRFFLLLLLITPLHAQDAEVPTDQPELTQGQRDFLNLPEEKRIDFAKRFGEASRFFQQKRIFECLEEVGEAEKIFANSSELLNLRGSCYVEMRAFDKAMVSFEEALKLSPDNTSIRFNVAEVLFVTRQWQKAHDKFLEILPDIPATNLALSRLVEFKLMLCKIKLGMDNEVIILANKYDFQDDSPFHYYARAVLAYEKDNQVEAEEWMGRANRIFRDQNIIAPWQDTLVEFGYIKSFYGEGNIAPE
jgi:tetratricopeptide (TPR) repeat protein